MTWQPWPGHPCEGHACDGCQVCRSGRCCCGTPGAADTTGHSHTATPSNERVLRDAIVTESQSVDRPPNLVTTVRIEALGAGPRPLPLTLADDVRIVVQQQITERSDA